jgi:hypothetical protein
VKVWPPRSPIIVPVCVCPALPYAVVKSVLALCVVASPAWFVPVIVTVPKPLSVVIAYVPTSPVIVVVPVLVIPDPARTAKLSAVPRFTTVAAEISLTVIKKIKGTIINIASNLVNTLGIFIIYYCPISAVTTRRLL